MASVGPLSAMTSEEVLQTKMTDHLSNTRSDIRKALQRFERHGAKIDRRFQRDFIKQTTDWWGFLIVVDFLSFFNVYFIFVWILQWFSVIDTCDQYCTKARRGSSRKDGKSSTEILRKPSENGKRRRSKERRSGDGQSTSKDDGLKAKDEHSTEPTKVCADKPEAPPSSNENKPDSPASKRHKNDDTHETTDVTDHSNAVDEMSGKDGMWRSVAARRCFFDKFTDLMELYSDENSFALRKDFARKCQDCERDSIWILSRLYVYICI